MNDTQFQQFLLHGAAQPTAEPRVLRAGPWTTNYIDGDLRYIKFRGHEAIRRIYAAIRDRNWGTIPGKRTEERVEVDDESFQISYQSHHQQSEIDFVWQSKIIGSADGTISFQFSGEARSDFYRNRIGYCVLHPSEICAGRQAEAHYATGKSAPLIFPRYVEANQPIPGFHDLIGLSHRIVDNFWCRISFEGDVFETEDQRNWIDASFKTYSTPLSQPIPVLIKAGTRIEQKVILRLEDQSIQAPSVRVVTGSKSTRATTDNSKCVQIEIESDAAQIAWPKIGTSLPASSLMNDASIVHEVRRLRFDHLRINATTSDLPLDEDLARQLAIASQLNVAVELAIDLRDIAVEAQSQFLASLSELLRSSHANVARIMVFGGPKPHVTATQAIQLVRQHLQWMGVSIGGGSNTDLYQYQLNPIGDNIDFLCWSMNPQVHASDDHSLAETPGGALEQTSSIRHASGGLPIVISPISLKPRFNPVAIGQQNDAAAALPPSVDARQMSLLAAAWTVGMLKAVSESGCSSATFFEAVGWRGFLEARSNLVATDLFPSRPGMLFPAFHLFEYLGQLPRPLSIQPTLSSSSTVASLYLQSGDDRHLILANLSTKAQLISIGNEAWEQIGVLNLEAVENGLRHPDQAGFQFKAWQNQDLGLESYAIAILESNQS